MKLFRTRPERSGGRRTEVKKYLTPLLILALLALSSACLCGHADCNADRNADSDANPNSNRDPHA